MEIKNQLKHNLQNHKFSFETNHNQITSDLTFIKNFVSQINVLKVDASDLNLKDKEEINDKLSNSNTQVRFAA